MKISSIVANVERLKPLGVDVYEKPAEGSMGKAAAAIKAIYHDKRPDLESVKEESPRKSLNDLEKQSRDLAPLPEATIVGK